MEYEVYELGQTGWYFSDRVKYDMINLDIEQHKVDFLDGNSRIVFVAGMTFENSKDSMTLVGYIKT